MSENPDPLSEEDEKILDKVWDRIGRISRLEEKGLGPKQWKVAEAREARPDLKIVDLREWRRIANEEYRRLRMKKVSEADARERAKRKANRKFPPKEIY